MMDEREKVFEAIARAAGDDQEAVKRLRDLTFRVEYLGILDGLLQRCSADRKMSYWCFLILRDLVRNRGCVLTIDEVMEHQRVLLEAGNGMCELLAGDVTVNNIFAEALAITYRMRIEKQNFRVIPFKELFHFFSLSPNHQVLAFNAMYFIIDALKTKLRHVTVRQQHDLVRSFAEYAVFDYIEGCFRVLRSEGHPMTELALGLFCDLYMFGSDLPFETFKMKWRETCNKFYDATLIPQNIDMFMKFVQADNPAISKKGMMALLCYGSIDSLTWPKRIMPYSEFWLQICQPVLHIMPTHSNTEALALFLAKFSHIVNMQEFCRTEFGQTFVTAALEFSKRALENEPLHLLQFWKALAVLTSCPEPIRNFPSLVFRQLFDMLVEKAGFYFGEVEEDIDHFDPVFEKLWNVVAQERKDACEYFLGAIDRINSLETFVVMVLLCGSLVSQSRTTQTMQLQGAIIKALMEKLGSMDMADNERVVIAENVILKFALDIREHLIKDRSNQSAACLQGIGMSRQQFYDYWIDRFMNDLYVFKANPVMLSKILNFVKEMMEHVSLRDFAKCNERLKKFVTREEHFCFSDIEFEHQRKLWIALYSIYTKNIKDEWPLFFQQFDECFTRLSDPQTAYILFCQVKGMLTAVESVKNDRMRAFRWFLNNHVEDSIKTIRACLDNRAVSSIIASVWTRICTKEASDFDEDTGDGILLFKGTRAIITAFLECTYQDKEWFVVKILRPSFRGRYANFGIMKMYGDDSFDVTCNIFFDLLGTWVTGETEKHMACAIDAIAALNRIREDLILSDERRLGSVCECLIDALLCRRNTLWVAACECLGGLMKSALNGKLSLTKFFQHFIVIIEGLIYMPLDDTNTRNSTKLILFLMIKYELQAVEKFFGDVVSAYEPKYRELVQPVFAKLIKAVNVERTEPEREFVSRIQEFQLEMQSYLIYISNMPAFAPIFKRHS